MTEAEFGQQKLSEEKQELKRYRLWLIDGILMASPRFTKEYLEKRPLRTLETIFDNC